MSSDPQLPELVDLYSLIGRMRVLSEPRTVACADKLMLTLIDTYFSPNQSVRELGTGQLRGSYNGAYFRYTGKQVEPASPATERWVAEDLAAGSEKLLLSYLRSLGDRQYYISSAVAGRGR